MLTTGVSSAAESYFERYQNIVFQMLQGDNLQLSLPVHISLTLTLFQGQTYVANLKLKASLHACPRSYTECSSLLWRVLRACVYLTRTLILMFCRMLFKADL